MSRSQRVHPVGVGWRPRTSRPRLLRTRKPSPGKPDDEPEACAEAAAPRGQGREGRVRTIRPAHHVANSTPHCTRRPQGWIGAWTHAATTKAQRGGMPRSPQYAGASPESRRTGTRGRTSSVRRNGAADRSPGKCPVTLPPAERASAHARDPRPYTVIGAAEPPRRRGPRATPCPHYPQRRRPRRSRTAAADAAPPIGSRRPSRAGAARRTLSRVRRPGSRADQVRVDGEPNCTASRRRWSPRGRRTARRRTAPRPRRRRKQSRVGRKVRSTKRVPSPRRRRAPRDQLTRRAALVPQR